MSKLETVIEETLGKKLCDCTPCRVRRRATIKVIMSLLKPLRKADADLHASMQYDPIHGRYYMGEKEVEEWLRITGKLFRE